MRNFELFKMQYTIRSSLKKLGERKKMKTHNLYVYANNLKHSDLSEKQMTEEKIRQVLRMIFLMPKPIYEIRMRNGSSELQSVTEWSIKDLMHQSRTYEGFSRLSPLCHQVRLLLDLRNGRVFQGFSVATHAHTLGLEITMPPLWEKTLWSAKQWVDYYRPLGDGWQIPISTVGYEMILQLNCSSAIVACLTHQKTSTVKMDRKKYRSLVSTKARDRGPQIKLMQRNTKRCFLLFMGTLWFKYCLALKVSVAEAFYWAVREVRETGLYQSLQGEKTIKDGFCFETNLFYWLCACDLIKVSGALSKRVKSVEDYPQQLHDYCNGKETAYVPTYSLKGLSFKIPPFLPRDFAVFIEKLNEHLKIGKPLKELFLAFFRGEFCD